MSTETETHVHVIGTGTIGEPLIGLMCDFRKKLGIGEISFSKRQALHTDRSKVTSLMKRGAKLCATKETWKSFEELNMKPTYTTDDAYEKATVIVDCTPGGKDVQQKQNYFEPYLQNTKGIIAQGSEFGFGKIYARGINDKALEAGKERFLQVASCNTHNLSILVSTIAFDDNGESQLSDGRFVCIRRSNDMSHNGSFVPSPQVNGHKDERFGTHHARDAHYLFKTMDLDLNLYSSALKINTQYMHTVWFNLTLDKPLSLEQVVAKLDASPWVALTHKTSANSVFSFGRDHGHFGRILNQTVVSLPSLAVKNGGREVVGFCFTPQDGNSLLSTVAATAFLNDPSSYDERIQCLAHLFFDEV